MHFLICKLYTTFLILKLLYKWVKYTSVNTLLANKATLINHNCWTENPVYNLLKVNTECITRGRMLIFIFISWKTYTPSFIKLAKHIHMGFLFYALWSFCITDLHNFLSCITLSNVCLFTIPFNSSLCFLEKRQRKGGKQWITDRMSLCK